LRDVVRRTTSAPPRQITRQGQTPKRALAAPSHHSNAPITPESQSFLSKIVARWAKIRLVLLAIARDSFLDKAWPVRPWIFLPEEFVPLLLKRFAEIGNGQPLKFAPRITPLEMIQPSRFQSWNLIAEMPKPACVPEAMRG
jgi:hypothetical protein